MYFDEIIKDLKNKKERREKGLYNGIPIHFKRYSQYFPSIDKGSYIGVLAATGLGKSKFVRDFALYRPLDFSMRTGYPIKILYFALEDPKGLVYKHMLRHYLWDRQIYFYLLNIWKVKMNPLAISTWLLLKQIETSIVN